MMTRYIKFVCLVISLGTAVTSAQFTPTSSSVAFVYVSRAVGGNNYEISAFAAASNGKLTRVSGSPFPADVQNMAVNGKYLFGTNGIEIDSFAIASDGSLTEVASINAQQFNNPVGGGPGALFLDHTGAMLYDEDIYGNNGANNTYQFFDIEKATGQLNYLGMTKAASTQFWEPLSFTGNNVYAYGSNCYHFDADIFGFERKSDGTLVELNINPEIPAAKSGSFYCPYLATADPTNYVAISLQPLNANSWQPDGPPQLAAYTVDGSGNLTTKSTYSNMPTSSVNSVLDIDMAPSGKLLAVGGTAGLQVFHFNGSNPITHYTGLLTTDEICQFFWDNDNHLYAISSKSGKLFVFTVTPTSVSQAPGSPYTIRQPMNIIVLPKT
ncbi:MAG: hypothetical protein WBE44_09360 [Terriglobales bacterium]|jgi:hypothetical protein